VRAPHPPPLPCESKLNQGVSGLLGVMQSELCVELCAPSSVSPLARSPSEGSSSEGSVVGIHRGIQGFCPQSRRRIPISVAMLWGKVVDHTRVCDIVLSSDVQDVTFWPRHTPTLVIREFEGYSKCRLRFSASVQRCPTSAELSHRRCAAADDGGDSGVLAARLFAPFSAPILHPRPSSAGVAARPLHGSSGGYSHCVCIVPRSW